MMAPAEEKEVMERVMQRSHDKAIFRRLRSLTKALLDPPPAGFTSFTFPLFTDASYGAEGLGLAPVEAPTWMPALQTVLGEIAHAHPGLESPEPETVTEPEPETEQ